MYKVYNVHTKWKKRRTSISVHMNGKCDKCHVMPCTD